MAVGLALGIAAGLVLIPLLRRIRVTNPALYPLQALAAAGVVYGLASVAHGSGFLAVFVAALLLGDAALPHKAEIVRFHTSLASLAEIVVFVALGLTVDVTNLARESVWLHGLILAVILALIARPLVAGVLLLPTRLRVGERLFVMWAGLKGAVPILLAAFVLLADVDEAARIYGIVFVVVAFSVVLQGVTIPFAAERLGVPIRTAAGGNDTAVTAASPSGSRSGHPAARRASTRIRARRRR
jgi:potassium/hydrogen antiporter